MGVGGGRRGRPRTQGNRRMNRQQNEQGSTPASGRHKKQPMNSEIGVTEGGQERPRVSRDAPQVTPSAFDPPEAQAQTRRRAKRPGVPPMTVAEAPLLPPTLLTREQFCEKYNVSRTILNRWSWMPGFPIIRDGKLVRIIDAQVPAWLDRFRPGERVLPPPPAAKRRKR